MEQIKAKKKATRTTWKKGKPGGPGRPKNPPDLAEARKFSAHEVEILFTRFIQMNREQLASVKNNPEATLLELTLHSIFTHAINKGDQIRLDFVLSRLIGKSRERIDIVSENKNIQATLDISDMVKNPEILKDLIKIETRFKQLRNT